MKDKESLKVYQNRDRELYERVRRNSTKDHEIRKLKNQILSLEAKKNVMKGIIAFQAFAMVALGGYGLVSSHEAREYMAIEQERAENKTKAQEYYDRVVYSMLNTSKNITGKNGVNQDIVAYDYQKLAQDLIERIERNSFDDSDVLISKIAKETNKELAVGHDVAEKMLPYLGYQKMSMDDYVKLKGYVNEEQFHAAMEAKEEWAYQMLMEQSEEKGLGL